MKLNDWLTTANPTAAVLYDIRNPPSSNTLAIRLYSGPRIDVCGSPTLALQSNK